MVQSYTRYGDEMGTWYDVFLGAYNACAGIDSSDQGRFEALLGDMPVIEEVAALRMGDVDDGFLLKGRVWRTQPEDNFIQSVYLLKAHRWSGDSDLHQMYRGAMIGALTRMGKLDVSLLAWSIHEDAKYDYVPSILFFIEAHTTESLWR